MKKIFQRGCLFLLAILLLGAVFLVFQVQPDLDPAVLEERYGGGASTFLDLPGGARVHLRDQGNPNGPALVLLHGSGASLHTWEPWVERLGEHLRLVTLDLPGHGLTGPVPSEDYSVEAMVSFLESVVRTLGLERIHLGGNSMGGAVAWNYALEYPQRVERLILVDAAGYPYDGEEEDPPLIFRLATLPGVGEVLTRITPRGMIEGNLRQVYHDDSQVTEDQISRHHDLLRREGNRTAAIRRLRAGRGAVDPARIPNISAPTLILWGEEDLWTPPEWAERFHRDLPHSELRTYPDVGHLPMEEAPEATAAAVLAFLGTPSRFP